MKKIRSENYANFRREVIEMCGISRSRYFNYYHGNTEPSYSKGLIIEKILQKYE